LIECCTEALAKGLGAGLDALEESSYLPETSAIRALLVCAVRPVLIRITLSIPKPVLLIL